MEGRSRPGRADFLHAARRCVRLDVRSFERDDFNRIPFAEARRRMKIEDRIMIEELKEKYEDLSGRVNELRRFL